MLLDPADIQTETWYNIGSFRTSSQIAAMMHAAAMASFGGHPRKRLIQLRRTTSPDGHVHTFQVKLLDEGMRNFGFIDAMQHIWSIMLDLKKAVPEYQF